MHIRKVLSSCSFSGEGSAVHIFFQTNPIPTAQTRARSYRAIL